MPDFTGTTEGYQIKTCTGRYFDLKNPTADMICINDVAVGLSKTCRFGGQLPDPFYYSVAEHCVIAARLAERDGMSREEQLAILLHDATEAYCGDMVKPLKNLVGSAYVDVEVAIEAAVSEAFGVPIADHMDVVKQYDMAMLIAERNFFWPDPDGVEWIGESDVRVIDVRFECLLPTIARGEFVRMYQWLTRG